jgi:hypothetical protein
MGRTQNTPIDQLTDAEVLELTNNGALGAGIVGKELAERAQRLKLTTNDGQFGPALTDPDYATKQAAKRAGRTRRRRLGPGADGRRATRPAPDRGEPAIRRRRSLVVRDALRRQDARAAARHELQARRQAAGADRGRSRPPA